MKNLVLPLVFTAATLQAGFYFELGPSYRIDWQCSKSHLRDVSMDTSIRDFDKYNNIGIWEIETRIETDHCNPFYIGADVKCGWVVNGNGNTLNPTIDETQQFHEIRQTELTGHTYDLQLYAGYRLYLMKRNISIIPCGGYEHHQKRFVQNNGFFNVNGFVDEIEQRDNFTHKDHLRGPFAGIDFEWVAKRPFFIFGGFHWNWYRFTSLGQISYLSDLTLDSSVENNFKSSEKAYVTGPSAFLGVNYNLTKRLYLCLKTSYYYTYLTNGTKTNTLLADTFDGDSMISQNLIQDRLRIDNLNWSSWSIQLMVGYDF